MSMLYVLIPLALMLLAVAVWAMVWAIRSGQFDDLESHGWSVVLDDDQNHLRIPTTKMKKMTVKNTHEPGNELV